MALWRAEGDRYDACAAGSGDAADGGVSGAAMGKTGHAFQYYRNGSAASAYGPTHVPDAAVRGAKYPVRFGDQSGDLEFSAADAVFHAIDVARGAGVKVAYDTNYRPSLWPAARASAIIHAAISQSSDRAARAWRMRRLLTGLSGSGCGGGFLSVIWGRRLVVLKMGARRGRCWRRRMSG